MKIFSLPEPPNPDDAAYQQNPRIFHRDMYKWACGTKSQLQAKSRTNDRAAAQSFVVSNYTTSSTLTGTDTLGNVADVLCTLIQSLIDKGILKSNIINQ